MGRGTRQMHRGGRVPMHKVSESNDSSKFPGGRLLRWASWFPGFSFWGLTTSAKAMDHLVVWWLLSLKYLGHLIRPSECAV